MLTVLGRLVCCHRMARAVKFKANECAVISSPEPEAHG